MPGGSNKGRPHERTIDRIRIAIRLEMRNLGMSSTEIAEFIGISVTAFSLLKRTTAYRIIKNQMMTGILSKMDEQVAENLDLNTKTLRSGVPIALENLLALASGVYKGQPVDVKVVKDASESLLDRDGRFAKVSRIGAPSKEQGGFADAVDQEVAGDLIKAVNTAKKPNIESPAASEAIM
jgi:hypothetical protein